MKKIIFVIHSLTGGGAERVASILSNKMANENYDVTIICLLNDTQTYYTDNKVKVVFIKSNVENRVKRNYQKFSKFRKVLREINPDCIIAFTSDCSMITAIASIGIKSKLIISERNDPNNDPSTKYMRCIRNVLYNIADGFVFQTPDAKNYYNKSIRKRSIIIGNPLNDKLPSPYNGIRENKIVAVNRLEHQKNIFLLLKAFNQNIRELDNYTLEIYGEGPLRSELQSYIDINNLSKKVCLKGYSSDIYKDIYKASLYVISSDYEGISNSMLEALALGIPVIATDCPIGGAALYIENGTNGYLVEVGNDEELGKKIVSLLSDVQLRNRFSNESIKIRDKLNVDLIIREWIFFIDRVVKL